MSEIEVWGTGKPVKGFTEDDVLTSARKGFPNAKAQDIARFIAGKRFVITKVKDEAAAQKLIEGLAKSGIEADIAGPAPSVAADDTPSTVMLDAIPSDGDEESAPDEAPAAPSPAAKSVDAIVRKNWKISAGVIAALVIAVIVSIAAARRKEAAEEAQAQATAELKARTSLAAKLEAEADAKRLADRDAAAKAKADAEQADRLAKREAAINEINSAYANGDYPSVIALSERFEDTFGSDPVVTTQSDNATFNLKEGARRGNFAAILNAPIKNSTRFNALKDWAAQVQERAKPVTPQH